MREPLKLKDYERFTQEDGHLFWDDLQIQTVRPRRKGWVPSPAIIEEETEDQRLLFLMTDLSPSSTGLPFVVTISQDIGNGQEPVVWVALREKMLPSEMATVTVDSPVETRERQLSDDQLKLVAGWIEANKDVILKHWRCEVPFEYSTQAIDAIKRIECYQAYAAFVDHAYDALGPKLARSWLDTPHREFDNMTPLDYGTKFGFDHQKLEGFLIRIEHGVFYEG